MTLAVKAGWISGQELVTIADEIIANFDVVPTETMTAIADVANRFAFLVNAREQQQLYDLIDAAIANGQTVRGLTQAISDSFNDGYHVLDDDGNVIRVVPTEYWTQTVARTELSRAQTIGQVAIYKAAGVKTMIWQSNHGQTVCDECDEANGDVVEMGEDFEGVDTDQPPAHPNCCCNVLPYDEDVRSELVEEKDAA
jgi:SPP1 gp7 family putative phage head morphogenesis protein